MLCCLFSVCSVVFLNSFMCCLFVFFVRRFVFVVVLFVCFVFFVFCLFCFVALLFLLCVLLYCLLFCVVFVFLLFLFPSTLCRTKRSVSNNRTDEKESWKSKAKQGENKRFKKQQQEQTTTKTVKTRTVV